MGDSLRRRSAVAMVAACGLALVAGCEDEPVADESRRTSTRLSRAAPPKPKLPLPVERGYRIVLDRSGTQPTAEPITGDFGAEFDIHATCRGNGTLELVRDRGEGPMPLSCGEEGAVSERVSANKRRTQLRILSETGTEWRLIVAVPTETPG